MGIYNLFWGEHSLVLGKQTRIMGILNITPDSFSDGGNFFAFDQAVAQGQKLYQDGADILDVGGESTRPFSDQVSAEEEIRRVVPVIEKLASRVSIPISIDTTKTEVARKALEAGASIIGGLATAPLSLASGTWIDMPGAFAAPERAIIALSVFHAVAYTGYIWLVGRAGPVFSSQVAYVVTLAGMALSAVFLGETYSAFAFAALVMMLAGLTLVQPKRTAAAT